MDLKELWLQELRPPCCGLGWAGSFLTLNKNHHSILARGSTFETDGKVATTFLKGLPRT